jgi:GcrA cell cycle regulator
MPTNDTGSRAWTEAQDAQLIELWKAGKTGAAIAMIMGGDLTRNSIIGRAHRLKLHERFPRPKGRVNVRRPAAQHGNRGVTAKGIVSRTEARWRAVARAEAQHRDNVPFQPGQLPPERDEGVDVSHLLGIMDLDQGAVLTQCRWPIGDPLEPGFGFCGAPCVEGKSYCATHLRRAYSGASASI